MATLYPGGDEPPRLVHPTQGQRFTLEELHQLVCFELEFYHQLPGKVLVFDEEGVMKRLPPNRAFHADYGLPIVGMLVGPILVLDPIEMPEE